MPQVIFDDEGCQLATRIPKTLHRAVKLAALEDNVPLKDWVCEALEAYLGELGGESGTAAADDTGKRRGGPRVPRVRASA
jgi:HicB family